MWSQFLEKGKTSDLAFLAARKRQSPRTGLVHLFHGSDSAHDTVPLYENFCAALAFLEQRKGETVLEAKELLVRLLAFQSPEGNFPIYLHDFPRCFDPHLGLKILPILLRILRDYSAVLGDGCKQKIEEGTQKLLAFYDDRTSQRPLATLWDFRFQVCKALFAGTPLPSPLAADLSWNPSDWWEYWVSLQFIQTPTCDFYHPGLGKCIGPFLLDGGQEEQRPASELIDWSCNPSLTPDHPAQIRSIALEGVQVVPFDSKAILNTQFAMGPAFALFVSEAVVQLHDSGKSMILTPFAKICEVDPVDNFSTMPERAGEKLSMQRAKSFAIGSSQQALLLWKEERLLHSLCFESTGTEITSNLAERLLQLQIDLPATFELQRTDLFETAFYVDASPDINIAINGGRATSFCLGDRIEISSTAFRINLVFECIGAGEFCGHVMRANRRNQRSTLSHEAFDWKIGLRTLRRSGECRVCIRVDFTEAELTY